MEFSATKRDVLGSSASRRLRRAGRVPAIVYGGEATPTNIELDHNEIFHLLRKESFYSSILKMKLDGKTENVLLRTTQWHPYKPFVLHVDFQRVNANEEITIKVPLHFVNAEISPAVKLSSAMISHISNEIEIVCLPSNLPQFIEVDLAAMEVGTTLHASNLKLPKGVSLAPNTEETVLVSALATQSSGDAEGDQAAASE